MKAMLGINVKYARIQVKYREDAEQKKKESNLKTVLSFLRKKIEKAATEGKTEIEVEIPLESERIDRLLLNLNYRQTKFNLKNIYKNGFYSPEITNIVEKEGFSVHLKDTRHPMTGVRYKKLKIYWN